MNSPLGNHWKEFFTQAQLEIMGEESQQTTYKGKFQRTHTATAVTRFTMWAYDFYWRDI